MTMPMGWDDKIRKDPDPYEIQEDILWSDQVTTGFFRTKVKDNRYISNLKVSTYHGIVSLADIDDIVVMNSKRMSQSQYSGYSVGRYTRFGTGNVKSNSRTVGDVVFMSGGRPVVTIDQVQDPQGVARLAKAARKELITKRKIAAKTIIPQQKTEVEKKTISLSDYTSRDPIPGTSSNHIVPDTNWRLTNSIVAPELIKSFEYRAQILRWIDGNPSDYYNRIIIHPIEKGSFIEIRNEGDAKATVKLNIVEIIPSIVWSTDFMRAKSNDTKLQLTHYNQDKSNLINPAQIEEVIIMNLFDSVKDNPYHMLNTLKNIENNSLYWLRVDVRVDQFKRDLYPLVPFYGLNEHISWYNMLMYNEGNTFKVKKFQAITNVRLLTYDYDIHEGRTLSFEQFDSVEVRPSVERGDYLYSTDEGIFTSPIKPSKFKNLSFSKDVTLLREGTPVFTFQAVQEHEKLLNVIQGIQNQFVKPHQESIPTVSNSSKSLNLRCAHCGKNVTIDSKFCNYCGARMTPMCSKCNHQNPAGSEFCSNCGFILN